MENRNSDCQPVLGRPAHETETLRRWSGFRLGSQKQRHWHDLFRVFEPFLPSRKKLLAEPGEIGAHRTGNQFIDGNIGVVQLERQALREGPQAGFGAGIR